MFQQLHLTLSCLSVSTTIGPPGNRIRLSVAVRSKSMHCGIALFDPSWMHCQLNKRLQLVSWDFSKHLSAQASETLTGRKNSQQESPESCKSHCRHPALNFPEVNI